MADINHSKTPNLSIDSLDGSAASVPSLTVTSRASFLCDGIAAFTGAESHTGAATFASTVSLGANGFSFAGLRRSTVSVAIGGTAADSVLTSAALSGITVGDPIIAIEKASIWSGSYHDLDVSASCVSWGAVQFEARNSAHTTVNTAAMNFTIYWLDIA